MFIDKVATDYVSMWINNDGDHYFIAKELAEAGELVPFEHYLRRTLRRAPEGSAAWHTSRELSENELDRVDWAEIARDLTSE